jgi:hypothetical protein
VLFSKTAALSRLAVTPGGGPRDRSSANTSEWSAAISCSQPSGRMPHCCAIELPVVELSPVQLETASIKPSSTCTHVKTAEERQIQSILAELHPGGSLTSPRNNAIRGS